MLPFFQPSKHTSLNIDLIIEILALRKPTNYNKLYFYMAHFLPCNGKLQSLK